MAISAVQSVGNFTATFSHPLINGGTPIALQGFPLDQEFFTTQQMMPNSKRRPFVGGGTGTLTNAVRAGAITFKACRVSDNINDGDIILIANQLQLLGDSIGGSIRVVNGMNGMNETTTFLFVTVETCPPVKMAGNDYAVYDVVFGYSDFVRG